MSTSGFRSFAFGALALPAFFASSAHAIDFCVGNVSDFNAAIITSQFVSGNRILLQQGTYHVGGTNFMTYDVNVGTLTIEGGYNSDCSVKTPHADNTIIDGDSSPTSDQRLTVNGNLSIDGVRFQHFTSAHHAIAFSIQHNNVDGQYTTIARSEFLGMGIDEFRNNAGSGTTRIVDTLVADSPGKGIDLQYVQSGNGDSPEDSVTTVLTNNTVAGSGDYGIEISSTGPSLLTSNIAWNNTTRDIYLERGGGDITGFSATFVDNTYGTRYGSEASGSSGTSNADPQFVAVNDFHLENSSPAINTGSLQPPDGLTSVDLDGNPRLVGSAPDRGAYESNVDDTLPFILTVTTTLDSGAGSLRQAILDANASPGTNIVTFNIPGTCPQTISLGSSLPSISQDILINGFTQPGSSANTSLSGDNAVRCVIVNGAGLASSGFFFSGPSDSQFIVEGLAMEGFTAEAIAVVGGAQDAITGNQFGGTVGTTPLTANNVDVLLGGLVTGVHIGGGDPGQRNVIGGATLYGVFIPANQFANSTGNLISNNLIGIASNGVSVNANGSGVVIFTSNNTVDSNIISGNTNDGVLLTGNNATGNAVSNNSIGLKSGLSFCGLPPFPPCSPNNAGLPNGLYGVRIEGGANHDRIVSNTIAYNASTGISVDSGLGNKLLLNSIYKNGGFGIDLTGSGLNDNDALLSALNLPNRGLNFPVITAAYGGLHHGWIQGTMSSTNGNYILQSFANTVVGPAGYGPGEIYLGLGLASVTNSPAGNNGTVAFQTIFDAPTASLSGKFISMLATDSDGNTSEFSQSVPYNCDVIFSDAFEAGAVSEACPALN